MGPVLYPAASEERPIGMFDSGVGGLTVMHRLINVLPNERVVYFGDTARLPYGDKSRDTILRYSVENTNFLLEKQVKLVVVACSTASSVALDHLQQKYSVPVIGTIDPGAEAAVKMTKSGAIAVLGTKGTINSGAYERAIHRLDSSVNVMSIACSLFVPLVEEQFAGHEAARLIVEEYLRPIRDKNIDTVVLGCTHYPLIKHLIADVLGPDVAIIDSAEACAQMVEKSLTEKSLHRRSLERVSHQYFVSDDTDKFRRLGKAFLGMPIEQVDILQPGSNFDLVSCESPGD